MSEGLDGSALPAVVPTAYSFSLGCSYSFSAALAGRCFMILASPTSWDLQWNPGFTFTMYAIVSQDVHSCVLHDSEARTTGMMLPSLTTAYLGCSQKLRFVVAFEELKIFLILFILRVGTLLCGVFPWGCHSLYPIDHQTFLDTFHLFLHKLCLQHYISWCCVAPQTECFIFLLTHFLFSTRSA